MSTHPSPRPPLPQGRGALSFLTPIWPQLPPCPAPAPTHPLPRPKPSSAHVFHHPAPPANFFFCRVRHKGRCGRRTAYPVGWPGSRHVARETPRTVPGGDPGRAQASSEPSPRLPLVLVRTEPCHLRNSPSQSHHVTQSILPHLTHSHRTRLSSPSLRREPRYAPNCTPTLQLLPLRHF